MSAKVIAEMLNAFGKLRWQFMVAFVNRQTPDYVLVVGWVNCSECLIVSVRMRT